jgi:lipoprotein-anchoring transpeptidase ErfK/SrfK
MTRNLRQTRRKFLTGLAAVPVVSACAPAVVAPPIPERTLYLDTAPDREVFLDFDKDSQAKIHNISEPRYIAVDPSLKVDQILVDQDRLVIQHIYAPGLAKEYPVGLGKAGLEFTGEAVIQRKAKWPSWRPTDSMIERNPKQYAKYSDGVPGGPGNPLGARALYLYRGNVDTYYRIHGTDAPETIGTYVSNGCIRMIDEHVIDLYERVKIGTTVKVV